MVSDKKIFKISGNENTLCWISNQHQRHKSIRGPSNEHFWQVWLKSVQRFQRRRFKCEKLTDGRRTLTHDKSSHGLWPGELKKKNSSKVKVICVPKVMPMPLPSISMKKMLLFVICLFKITFVVYSENLY